LFFGFVFALFFIFIFLFFFTFIFMFFFLFVYSIHRHGRVQSHISPQFMVMFVVMVMATFIFIDSLSC
jgi:hypothetical protein